MNAKKHQPQAVLTTLFLLMPALLFAQRVTIEDYKRANNLEDQFEGKALNVVDNATWIGDTHYLWYRKSVQGGHKFMWVNAVTQQKRNAFDHGRLAKALSMRRDTAYSALQLPFDEIKYVNNESTVEIEVRDSLYTCNLNSYTCEGELQENDNQWQDYNPFEENGGKETVAKSEKQITSPNGV